MKSLLPLVSLALLAAASGCAGDGSHPGSLPACHDCGTVRSIQPLPDSRVGAPPTGSPAGGIMGGVMGRPVGGSMAVSDPAYQVLVKMDDGGMQTITVRDIHDLHEGDRVRLRGPDLERVR